MPMVSATVGKASRPLGVTGSAPVSSVELGVTPGAARPLRCWGGGAVVLSRYDAVLSALNAGVVIHAADTEILDANDRARDLLGLQHLEGRLATDPQWVFLEADHSPMTLERFPVMQVIASRSS